jgi:hypothetical protein
MKRPDVRRIFDKIRNLCGIRFVLERVMLWKIMKGDVSASPPVYEVETAVFMQTVLLRSYFSYSKYEGRPQTQISRIAIRSQI